MIVDDSGFGCALNILKNQILIIWKIVITIIPGYYLILLIALFLLHPVLMRMILSALNHLCLFL